MKNQLIRALFLRRKRLLKLLMRTFIFLLCTTVFSFSPRNSFSQEKVTIDTDKVVTVDEVFQIIKKQTNYRFIYQQDMFKDLPVVSLKKGTIKIERLLQKALAKGDFNYTLGPNNTIRIQPKVIIDKASRDPITVTGRITDEDGVPLPGATVQIKGTNTGVAADFDGNYRITVPNPESILVFTNIGFTAQEVTVGNQTTINVTMVESVSKLDDVVVVGYGTQSLTKVSSAITKIKAEDVENIPVVGVDELIQGQAAGVQVTSNSGIPGGGVVVRIRGQNSINAGNDPLFVVDGVPILSGSLAGAFNDQTGIEFNVLSNLNPEDIESIEILKDAGATAIYGSRAANGVVLITTKSGISDKTRVSFDFYSGFAESTSNFEVLNAAQYKEIKSEAYTNDGIEIPADILNIDSSLSTDWQDEIYRTAFLSQYQIGVNGGNERTRYYLSAGFRDEEAILKNSDFKRANVRLNLDQSLGNTTKIGARLNLARSNANRFSTGGGFSDVVGNAIIARPDIPLFDENGDYTEPVRLFGFFPVNPVEELLETKNESITTSFIGNVFLEWQLLKGLKFRGDLGYDYQIFEINRFSPASTIDGSFSNGFATSSVNQSDAYNFEPRLNYNPYLGEYHNLDIVLGTTFFNRVLKFNTLSGSNFLNDDLNFLISAGNIAPVPQSFTNRSDYSFNSIFGRVNYDYKSKYLFSATFRRDGSSRFGPDNRYGNFWALSGGWIFTNEGFLKDNKVLDFGKIRSSIGVTGNDLVGDFGGLNRWTVNNGFDGNPGIAPVQLGNPNLKWEETTKFDLGLELSLFGERLRITGDYFINRTKDVLLQAPLPNITGFNNLLRNIGETENSGIEVSVASTNIRTDNFEWRTTLNISKIDNEIIRLVDDEPIILQGGTTGYFEGEPINVFYGLDFLNIDPATGDAVYRDVNGNGEIDRTEDRTILGSAIPDFFGGITNSFRWKGFDLSIFFQFVDNVQLFDNSALTYYNGGTNLNNQSTDILRRWQQPGDITDIPRVTTRAGVGNNNRFSDRFLWDASYLRLKNATLSWRLPKRLVDKLSIDQARISLTGTNLLTITDFPGLDPEATASNRGLVRPNNPRNPGQASGILNNNLPQTRMYLLGLNFTF